MEYQPVSQPPWTAQNTSEKESIGLIGSKSRRKSWPDHMSLPDLINRHASSFKEAFLFVTWGTYFDLFLDLTIQAKLKTKYKAKLKDDEGRLAAYCEREKRWEPRYRNLKYGYSLRPGKRGGILEMAEHLEKSAGSDRIKTLIFLEDPADLEERYPEDLALFRSALRNNVLFLVTGWSASHWAAYEEHDGIPKSGQGKVKRTNPQGETLALIAHDDRKLELCHWVVKYCDRIRQFKRFVTTGTTGEWVQKFLEAAGVPKQKIMLVDRKLSGPWGGDIEIAGAVLRGEIEHVVFFVDPMTSHPHEADVQAFLRVCVMPGLLVNLRLTERAATSWIETVTREK